MSGLEKSIHIKTFGCQMNVFDSDRMESILVRQGYRKEADLAKADVLLINTCSIRDKSEHKVLSLLGQLKPLKEKYPHKVIGITGCVGQRMGRALLQRVAHLDLVMGPDGVERVGELVEEVVSRGRRVLETSFDNQKERSYSQPAVIDKVRPSEFLTVMKGCDHFCTYCIVPFVRGREKSRPIAELLDDVRRFVDRGTKEITFLGQNINTYGKRTGESLAELVLCTNEIQGVERIRYVTSHPRDLGMDLIRQFGQVEKLCPALHLPFQSGSNAVLKRMARLYTREEYLEKIAALRAARSDIALSTDVIVGFPGETDQDFEQSMDVIREVGFSGAFLFKYSPRPGTRAFEFGEEVPDSVKTERLAHLQEVCFGKIHEENKGLVGSTVSCLIEALDKKGRYYTGRTPHGKLVHVLNAGEACIGKILDVEVTEGNASNLKGYYVGAPRQDRTRDSEKAVSA
ncbi:MAG: tRNA (N6-isopentenyl adenosine(37)-C2)-methylthiotransferase MiaB [Bdellovibrionales bacterium]|nr:tRNA (N6-isopentenyl adenosine(37)-C2)-methylthiotransferase MiaB [Bdellovibrionales bacterium]